MLLAIQRRGRYEDVNMANDSWFQLDRTFGIGASISPRVTIAIIIGRIDDVDKCRCVGVLWLAIQDFCRQQQSGHR